MNDIISERGACGVGFVANLKNEPSFNIVRDALTALGCMEHRGGCGADNDSGDGAGLMSGIPWDLFNDWANKQGIAPFDRTNTGVGMVFLPQDEKSIEEAKAGNVSDALPLYSPEIREHFLSLKCNTSYVYMDQRFVFANACGHVLLHPTPIAFWNFHAAILRMPRVIFVLEIFVWNVLLLAHYFSLV